MVTTAVGDSRFVYKAGQESVVMRQALELKAALDRADWKSATDQCIHLVESGRHVIGQQVHDDRDFDPVPITLSLFKALNSEEIQWQPEVRYHIARAGRLFIELMCMKKTLDKLTIVSKTQENLRTIIDEQANYSKDHVALTFELKCCSEALKLLEEIDTKEYLTILFKSAASPGKESIATLLSMIPKILAKKSKDWFSEVLFLSWMGGFAKENQKLFLSLRDSFAAQIDKLEIAQAAVEFFADIAWNGNEELKMEALKGPISLISLLNMQRSSFSLSNITSPIWPVRYRAAQVLATLMDHKIKEIANAASEALLDRWVEETNGTVADLLMDIKGNPGISAKWKVQFEKRLPQVLQQNEQRKQELKKVETQFLARERALTQKPGQSAEDMKAVRAALEAEKRRNDELRRELEAKEAHVQEVAKSVLRTDVPAQQATLSGSALRKEAESLILEQGDVAQSLDKAVKLIQESARLGDRVGQYYMGWLCDEARGTSIALRSSLEADGKKGDSVRYIRFHLFDHTASYNLRKVSDAYDWYLKSANQGYVVAENHVGWCHSAAAGVPKSHEKAVVWYRKAADKEFATAQDNMAVCFEHGKGVEQSLVKAAEWYVLGAMNENAHSQYKLAIFYRDGKGGVSPDRALCVFWLQKAALQGYAAAQTLLGWCHETGYDGKVDLVEAKELYTKAAQQGDKEASANLERLK